MAAEVTSGQKAAAVVISLGADIASQVYRYLRDDDIEKLTYEIARLSDIGSDTLESILEDFYSLCVTQKVITEGGVDYARNVLEKAFGEQRAHTLLDRITKSLEKKAFEFIRKADYKNLLAIIQNEHPQTIALILSYARADQAATIVSELPKDKRISVVERIARMDRASPEVIRQVESVLERRFASVASSMGFMEIGGINYTADIMNHIDRSAEKAIFDELYKRDPKLADEIRKRMFVFEDIVMLDSIAVQRFLRDVDSRDLVVALKGSSHEVQEVFFANMSQRMGETVRTDMEYLQNVRMRDVEEAQQKIVATIRALEERGEIIIAKAGGKDDIIL